MKKRRMKMKTQGKKYKLKITCLTPKGKAKRCMKDWQKSLMVFNKPIKRGVISDIEFYYIYEFDKLNDMYTFNKRILALQPKIKLVYGAIIRIVKRANKIMNKGRWATKKVKRWFMKRIRDVDTLSMVDAMSEEEFKDYLAFSDVDDINAFLKKDIIKTEFLEVK